MKKAVPKRPKVDVLRVTDHFDEITSDTDLLVYVDKRCVVNLRAENGQLVIRTMGAVRIRPDASNCFTLELPKE